MFACTRYCGDYSAKISLLDAAFKCILAIRGRAPLQVLLVINIGASKEYLVSVCRLIQLLSILVAYIPSLEFHCHE